MQHSRGIYTTDMAKSKVNIHPKAERRDATLPKSFRPISLLSLTLTAVEKTVDNQDIGTNKDASAFPSA